jgi:NAD(P)-dependent dehydrogenase (short-subunit alcohol dehydrogenase family)
MTTSTLHQALARQTVVILGSSSGIGLETAQQARSADARQQLIPEWSLQPDCMAGGTRGADARQDRAGGGCCHHQPHRADLIVGLLHSYGLHAAVSADDAGGQEPQLQLQGVRVLVAPSDEAAARDVLAGSAHLGADPESLHRLREGEGLGVDEKVGGEPGIGHDAPGPAALHREVPRVVEREDD